MIDGSVLVVLECFDDGVFDGLDGSFSGSSSSNIGNTVISMHESSCVLDVITSC